MSIDAGFWDGRRVLVTGHTGFKGSWLLAWLSELGAHVTGLALPPATEPSLFARAGLERHCRSVIGDIRDPQLANAVVADTQPEVVIHLAAQPLVLDSLRDPVGTFATNLGGTLNLLQAIRDTGSIRAVVVVTSDKCYRDAAAVCVEDDPLGGADPYSASKACAEIAVAAWRACFLQPERGCGLATARAGNVIGGGDFSRDRLLPDLVRAAGAGQPALLRHPSAVRPWQHVLDALAGYLTVAQRLALDPARFARPWNFGPPPDQRWTAADVADCALRCLGRGSWRPAGTGADHEAPALYLSAARARDGLGWSPRLSTTEAIAWSVEGYRRLAASEDDWMRDQIGTYSRLEPMAPQLALSPAREVCHA
jgi:CDP-glucose 4,6-dehydratase